MHKLALLSDLAIVWLSALLGGGIFASLRLPVIAGYILIGILIGPSCLKLISQPEQIDVLAEFGVALLLFSLGVELSFRQIFQSGKSVIFAGLTQICLVVAMGAGLAYLAGISSSLSSALLIGFVCALSSTAVVMKGLIDRGETETPLGRILIPILLVQDLALIPVMAILPSLQSESSAILLSIAMSIGKAALVVAMVFLGARYGVPKLLSWVAILNSKELFILAVLSICLTVSLLAGSLGLSLALGGFLAGLMVSERPYGLQVLTDVSPLKNLFSTLFFVSVGLLLNPDFIVKNWALVCMFCLVLVLVKTIAGAIASLLVTRNKITAARVGIATAQLGEFSFVLTTVGYSLGLIDTTFYQLFIAGAVVTLTVSPVLAEVVEKIAAKHQISGKDVKDEAEHEEREIQRDHLILKGFGRTGRHLALILKDRNVPFVVIEVDGQKIVELQALGIPFVYGDALSMHVLEAADIENARCFIITGPDMFTNRALVKIARELNPKIKIIARAPRIDDVDVLLECGANAAVQPEFEASIEITKLALVSMSTPYQKILESVGALRSNGYTIFKPDLEMDPFIDFSHDDYYGLWYLYRDTEGTLDALDIRKNTGVTILAVKSEGELVPHPDGATELKSGDLLYVSGTEYQIFKFEDSYNVSQQAQEVLIDGT